MVECGGDAEGDLIRPVRDLDNTNIDPALMRPGRCFATLHTRSLTPTEGSRLIARLCGGDLARERFALARTFPPGTKTCSVASIYRACASVST